MSSIPLTSKRTVPPPRSSRRVVLVPRSFNPPTMDDVRLIQTLIDMEELLGGPYFDVIALCLIQEEAPAFATISTEERVTLLQAILGDDDRLIIDPTFAMVGLDACADDLKERYTHPERDVAFVVPFSDITTGIDGRSYIERVWQNGTVHLATSFFYVCPERGQIPYEHLLPARATYLSSATSYDPAMQEKVYGALRSNQRRLHGLLPQQVLQLIQKYNLYSDNAP